VIVQPRTGPLARTGALPEQDVRTEESRWTDATYVTYVFQSYFGYAHDKAERLMHQVHEEGRAIVSHGTREQMETDTQAMHGFGLWATVQTAGR
jgi:ATP-dependent Clp protease adaptor protein ClpS